MSTTSGGPNIVTNGLVLHLDAANTKSFRGIPATNLVQPWATSSVLPLGYGYNQYEYNAELADPPIRGTQFDNVKWIKFTKNLGTNGRSGFLSLSGLNTGTTYMWSTYIYTNDSRVTSLSMGTDNSAVSFSVTGSAYNATNSGSLQRISCSFKSVSGSVLHGIRGGSTDATGSYWYTVGSQVEDNAQATPVIFGSRGATVATGGGWADRTPNQNHGELVNGVSYNSANGGRIVFDGVDDYIDLGSNLQLSNNFTLCVWHINPNTGYIIDQGNIGGDPTNSLEYLNYGLTLSANNISSVTADGTITTTRWNFVCVSFSSATTKFYINGVLDSTKTASFSSFTPSGKLKIGRRAFNTSSIFSGSIGMVMIYNKVLTDNEILQNYNSQKSRFGLP
jgi:hypothetical protein